MGKAQGNYYQPLGFRLRRLRQKRQQSLEEVSGAVEIDTDILEEIEQGSARPSEDVLLLLLSHFNLADDEANQLWELAGYASDNFPDATPDQEVALGRPMMLVMPMDARIVYTDMVHVNVNDYGVVMNFLQHGGPGNQPLAVARVGMSRKHAESVSRVINEALARSDQTASPKALPAPKPRNRPSADK